MAKNYDRAKRYEVARSEYTTVVNRYPETPEATEARFGIGETLMAQKIFKLFSVIRVQCNPSDRRAFSVRNCSMPSSVMSPLF